MEGCGPRASGAGGGAVSILAALALAGSIGLTACAPSHAHPVSPGEATAPVSIEVDNQGFHDAVISTLIDGVRTRLGTVTGEGERTFTIQWTPLSVSMQVHVIGGATYDTDAVSVQPGDRLKVIVMPGVRTRINFIGQI